MIKLQAGTKVGPDQLGPPVRVGSTRIDSDRIKKNKNKIKVDSDQQKKINLISKTENLTHLEGKKGQIILFFPRGFQPPFCFTNASSSRIMLWTHGWVTRRAFCFKDRDMDDLEEGKISTTCFIPKKSPRMYIFAYFLVYWIIYEKSIKGLVCWSHLDSYRRVRLKSVLIPVCFFLQDFWNLILMMLNFNAAHIHFQWTFSTWKEEKPCSPGTKEIFMPRVRIELVTLRFSC